MTVELEKASYTVKVTLTDYKGAAQYTFSGGSAELKVKLTKISEYDQFGSKKIPAEAYNKNFEIWPTEDNKDWNARAFFQMCVVIEKSALDLTEGVGTKNYAYKFEVYYRSAGSKESFKGGYTVPMETLYNWGDAAIYRFQLVESSGGDMLADWQIGKSYEVVIKYIKGSTVLGYSSIKVDWTQDYYNEYLMYKTFWKRHDRTKGYKVGDNPMTNIDIIDPLGKSGTENDGIDRTNMQPISSQNSGYGNIIREKSTGEILFSPNIENLRAATDSISAGQETGYLARLVFTIKDYNGDPFYTYPAIILPIYQSKGEWFDTFLQGEGIDCGFCPQAGREYDVYMEVLSSDGKKALYYGEYNYIKVSESLGDNKYYQAIPVPGEENLKFTVSFEVRDGVGGTIKGSASQELAFGEYTTSVEAIPAEGYVFLQWSDGLTTPVRPAEKVKRNKTYTAIFIKESASNAVSDMYITTDTGNPITNKTYVTGTVRIVSKNAAYNLDTVTMQIRGRGNSSFNGGASQSSYDSKNSYRLKLDEKASLLGMGSSNKDWVLNSNKFDAVGLRCFATWQLASYMDTLPYVTECAWVNMYINGQYRGMYMVTELIEVANDRVEVEDNINGTDKGFLIELDFRGNGDGGQLGLDYFYVDGYSAPWNTSDNAIEFVIKSKVNSEEETSAIEDYVVLCHEALMSGNRAEIDKYVDIPSLIDMFILEELSKDVDVGCASFFIQKDVGGKLYFTAPWDFDFGYGTYGPATSIGGFHSEGSSRCEWFKALMKHDWFRKEVLARMNDLDDDFAKVIKDVKAKGEELYIAGDRNATFWNIYGNHYHAYVSGSVSSDLYSYQEHIDYLVIWMQARWDWMKDNL